MADEESFVRRWSRRKAAAREQARAAAKEPAQETDVKGIDAAPTPAEQGSAPPVEAPERHDQDPAVDLEALPDIESLTYESDYTVFLRKGVPAELRKRALARLWRSDPVLANLDGLVEYGEDYTKIGTVKEVVRTAYQVGRGMLERLEPGTTPRATPEPAGIDTVSGRREISNTALPAREPDAERGMATDDAPAAMAAAVNPADQAAPQPPHQEADRKRGRASTRPLSPRRSPKRR